MINLKTKEWNIENIDTILFDKDGTLINLHYFWGKMTELRVQTLIEQFKLNNNMFKKLCLDLGYNTETKKMLKDGITALYSRQKIIRLFAERLNSYNYKISEKAVEQLFDEVNEIFYENINDYTKPIKTAIEFIRKTKQSGIKTGIVTADSVISTNKTLDFLQITNLFDTVIGRESTKDGKESGVPVLLALKNINSRPENSIMIGDAPTDYIAAKNANIKNTILVATGQITKNDLQTSSKYTVDNLQDVTIY